MKDREIIQKEQAKQKKQHESQQVKQLEFIGKIPYFKKYEKENEIKRNQNQ
ncbi:hypothetical protein J6253_07795 [bacterium]|nr:hypothetical protein [bacterium]